MDQKGLQGELFNNKGRDFINTEEVERLEISSKIIEIWQQKVSLHQEKLMLGLNSQNKQISLFNKDIENPICSLNPLKLTPLPLNFWRWPTSPHVGPAIYLVMDKLDKHNKNIILYIGETIAAEKRWKGYHDCKEYIYNYSELLQKAGLKTQLNIRFWIDVPRNTRKRRTLEQQLIQNWLPPFNKETRQRWATPFTSELIR